MTTVGVFIGWFMENGRLGVRLGGWPPMFCTDDAIVDKPRYGEIVWVVIDRLNRIRRMVTHASENE